MLQCMSRMVAMIMAHYRITEAVWSQNLSTEAMLVVYNECSETVPLHVHMYMCIMA